MNPLFKTKRLKRSKIIEALFLEGKALSSFPIRLMVKEVPPITNGKGSILVGFSVPKRNFKKAVDRNRIKRLLREAYRKQNKIEENGKSYAMMIIYLGKEKPQYAAIEGKLSFVLKKFEEKYRRLRN